MKEPTHYLWVFRDEFGGFRWRLRNRQSDVIAECVKSYSRPGYAVKAFRDLYRAFDEETIDFRDYEVVAHES